MSDTNTAEVLEVPSWVLIRHPGTKPEDWKPCGKGWAHVTATIGICSTIGDDSTIGDGSRIGDDSTIGNDSTIGDGSRIGNRSTIGDGSRIGICSTIGDGSTIGICSKWMVSPLNIQGSRHALYAVSLTELGIGCRVYPVTEWLKRYKAIGRANGYTPEEIAEYGLHIKYAAKWLEANRHRILGEPKPEPQPQQGA